nr:MAG TPA: hypothetical protein [Bacteriophage sp.]
MSPSRNSRSSAGLIPACFFKTLTFVCPVGGLISFIPSVSRYF